MLAYQRNKSFLLLLFVSIFLIGILFGCSDSSVKPIEEEDIQPQFEIEWPSLSDSPWPMSHADPQSTGRSKYTGPKSVASFTQVYVEGLIEMGISIGGNNTAYYASAYTPWIFYAVDYNGNEKWKVEESYSYQTTPIITSSDNIIIAGGGDVRCFSSSGDIIWEYKNSNSIVIANINIDKNGNVYFLDNSGTLKCLDNGGNFIWALQDERFQWWATSSLTFSADGATLYLQGLDVSIIAVDIATKLVKWTFGDLTIFTQPVVDSYDNIYIIYANRFEPNTKILYSLNNNGNVNWQFNFFDNFISNSVTPTIDWNGNIYFGADTLYSVNYKGSLRWKIGLEGSSIESPLICDIENNIYVGVMGGASHIRLLSFNDKGENLWEIQDNIATGLGTSPALTEDGSLFYSTWSSLYFFIIK